MFLFLLGVNVVEPHPRQDDISRKDASPAPFSSLARACAVREAIRCVWEAWHQRRLAFGFSRPLLLFGLAPPALLTPFSISSGHLLQMLPDVNEPCLPRALDRRGRGAGLFPNYPKG